MCSLPTHVYFPRQSIQTNMAAFQQEHPEFGSGLLSFALEYMLASKWPGNSMSSYNDCDPSCTVGEPCGCTCTEDFDSWSDSQVRRLCMQAKGVTVAHLDQMGWLVPSEFIFLLGSVSRALRLVLCGCYLRALSYSA